MSDHYDAIVVGGGPSGATAGILLAEAGWKVAVVEKAVFPRRKVCGEFISETTWPLLRRLGVADALLRIAGPVVKQVGVFVETTVATAGLTGAPSSLDGGRAVGREHLDAALLDRAKVAGADVLQPWSLASFSNAGDHYACRLAGKPSGRVRELSSRLIIAAHGSWEPGPLPTQSSRRRAHASDLFGFKAHFLDSALAHGLMPLLGFPGGYGGLVHSDGGRTSLSCCIRRDQLQQCREARPDLQAGAAVQAHIEAHCDAVASTLAGARREGPWLAAGPLRTGIGSFGEDRIFAVGNAAAEAHPVVAEGISMAIQSATLLCDLLVARGKDALSDQALAAIHHDYQAAWRRNFSQRLRTAALYAHLFMRPASAVAAAKVMQQFPGLLTFGARLSGKDQALRTVGLPADSRL